MVTQDSQGFAVADLSLQSSGAMRFGWQTTRCMKPRHTVNWQETCGLGQLVSACSAADTSTLPPLAAANTRQRRRARRRS